MTRTIPCLFAVLAFFLASLPAHASLTTGIVAVVNDDVITTNDLDQRMKLALLTSGLPDTEEVRKHLFLQILRGLVDERLQEQEAQRQGLLVSDDEIAQAMARIAHDNGIEGDFEVFLKDRGVSPDAMRTQLRAALLWGKVIQREIRPRVDVGDEDVDAVIERIRAHAGKEEALVSEIVLTVDDPEDEARVRKAADDLIGQIRQGANFGAVARQFSQSASAAQGGDMGWIQNGQFLPELNAALERLNNGDVSDPIRTVDGFHILWIRDKRRVNFSEKNDTELTLKQIFKTYESDTEAFVRDEAKAIRDKTLGCDNLGQVLGAYKGWKEQDLDPMMLSKAPEWFSSSIKDIEEGGSSNPLNVGRGVVVLFVCGRKDVAGVDRNAILDALGTEKMALQSRRLLRDLRRTAYMDIRLAPSR
ncbi:MAG: peptidylprolyl isomerase [Alphaproteobacteria bacterium]|nr:peptidylprolyl isomerase [Alphaproteobacteria bacterium]